MYNYSIVDDIFHLFEMIGSFLTVSHPKHKFATIGDIGYLRFKTSFSRCRLGHCGRKIHFAFFPQMKARSSVQGSHVGTSDFRDGLLYDFR